MAQILSDLHLEFRSIPLALELIQNLPVRDRLLILAGDIHNKHIYRVLEIFSKKWERVIFVPGNHDFYGELFRFQNQRFDRIQSDLLNVSILQNSTYLDPDSGLLFAGTTLWFSGIPKLWNKVGDFKYIKENRFIPKMNLEAQKFLLQEAARADIVVTHHAPSAFGINPEYVPEEFQDAYVTPMLDVENPFGGSTWIHGHIHVSYDIQRPSGVRMIANCAGYDWDVPNFDAARNYTLRRRNEILEPNFHS